MRLTFVPIHVFRETPAVTFFDASVEGSNGTDVVAQRQLRSRPLMMSMASNIMFTATRLITTWC